MRGWLRALLHAGLCMIVLAMLQALGLPVRLGEALTFAVAITALQRTYAAHPTHTNDRGE